MNDWDSEDKIAGAANLPGLDSALREQLLSGTVRVVRWRRRRRHALQVAAVVLAFVAGMLTMDSMRRAPEPAVPVGPESLTVAAEPAPADIVVDDRIFDDPEALTVAFDAADSEGRLRLLKRAGDYELQTRRDVRSALQYYEQWVRLADSDRRTRYDDSDTWLLASLKHSD